MSSSDSYRQCVQGGNLMRMSLMFAAVTLLTGINLLFIPFQPVPALWGGNPGRCFYPDECSGG